MGARSSCFYQSVVICSITKESPIFACSSHRDSAAINCNLKASNEIVCANNSAITNGLGNEIIEKSATRQNL